MTSNDDLVVVTVFWPGGRLQRGRDLYQGWHALLIRDSDGALQAALGPHGSEAAARGAAVAWRAGGGNS